MTDIDHNREALTEAVRSLNDLADVIRAIAVAAKLVTEKLEEISDGLVNVQDHL